MDLLVHLMGFEPTRIATQEPKSCMSSDSITGAYIRLIVPSWSYLESNLKYHTMDYNTIGCCFIQIDLSHINLQIYRLFYTIMTYHGWFLHSVVSCTNNY